MKQKSILSNGATREKLEVRKNTMGRQENIEIFEDTFALCKRNSTLRDAIEQSAKKQKLYPKGVECAEKQAITYAQPAKIIVSPKRTLEAAMPYAYAGKKVCIHNFASAANPGGGVTKGSSAQEEAICRCSTLYPNLKEEILWKEFYAPHRRQQNPLHNDDCIYTPGVIAFKSDTTYPKLYEKSIDNHIFYPCRYYAHAGEKFGRKEGDFYPIMEFIHAYGEQLLVDDLKRFDVKVMELATAEEVENLYRTAPNEPYQAAYIKVMDRKTDTVYSRIYVFCAGQEEKCLNGDTYLSNKQHYVLVKKGDDTYKVPYPFDCDRTVEALNRKNSEEEALTAAQRLFFWTEYKKTIKLD